MNFIWCFLAGKQELWDKYLPTLRMAIRATVTLSTGYTSNIMVLSHDTFSVSVGLAKIPVRHFGTSPHRDENTSNQHSCTRNEIMMWRTTCNILMWEIWCKNRMLPFELGEQEVVGPYVVMKVLSPSLFRVVDQKGEHIMHHDKLKLGEDWIVPL